VNPAEYQVIRLPASRMATMDLGQLYRNKHYMFGLLEVDVTEARRAARALRRDGTAVSFTAWMIKAIGNCVARNRRAHALSLGRDRAVVFTDVDIALPVEKVVGDTLVPLPMLIKKTNAKSVQEINGEIERALDQAVRSEKDFILNEHQFSRAALRFYYAMPGRVRVFLMKMVLDNPFKKKDRSGTVTVTTVNAIGRSAGWILPTRGMHSLEIAFGSVTAKAWVVDGTVTVRDIMHLTVIFDHDAIDGMPARRFVQDLVRHIETADLGDAGCDPRRGAGADSDVGADAGRGPVGAPGGSAPPQR
jgi:hypothetical protein